MEAKPAKVGLHFFYSVVIAYSKLDYSELGMHLTSRFLFQGEAKCRAIDMKMSLLLSFK